MELTSGSQLSGFTYQICKCVMKYDIHCDKKHYTNLSSCNITTSDNKSINAQWMLDFLRTLHKQRKCSLSFHYMSATFFVKCRCHGHMIKYTSHVPLFSLIFLLQQIFKFVLCEMYIYRMITGSLSVLSVQYWEQNLLSSIPGKDLKLRAALDGYIFQTFPWSSLRCADSTYSVALQGSWCMQWQEVSFFKYSPFR
jgi:hypothetical protein